VAATKKPAAEPKAAANKPARKPAAKKEEAPKEGVHTLTGPPPREDLDPAVETPPAVPPVLVAAPSSNRTSVTVEGRKAYVDIRDANDGLSPSEAHTFHKQIEAAYLEIN
jgi:hypothetical protein